MSEFVLLSQSMTDENAGANQKIDDYVSTLKSKIPKEEHGALESRAQALMNDADADYHDVISALQQEFDPGQK